MKLSMFWGKNNCPMKQMFAVISFLLALAQKANPRIQATSSIKGATVDIN
jgi:hypothetical protein